MDINQAEAEQILSLATFAENESCANTDELALAKRVIEHFKLEGHERLLEAHVKHQQWDAERKAAPPPETLDLSLAASVPGVWPPATGQKEIVQW
jgi:hypothetical protein